MKDDYQTSTVDGAAGFQRAYNSERNDDTPSRRELANEAAAERFKAEYGREWWEEPGEDEYYDDDDRCNCSDPGCPCGGNKRGGL